MKIQTIDAHEINITRVSNGYLVKSSYRPVDSIPLHNICVFETAQNLATWMRIWADERAMVFIEEEMKRDKRI